MKGFMSTLYFVENLVLNFTLESLRPKNEKEDECKFSPREVWYFVLVLALVPT